MITIHIILIITAIVLFILAAVGVASRINLVALGLAILAAAFLTGCTPGSYTVVTPWGGGTVVVPEPTPGARYSMDVK